MENANILIVDDRIDNLMVLEGVLEDVNCNIIRATSGNEALGLMCDHDFALVLLDVQMPEMDGFEMAELMRGRERTRHIPIIFVTAISKELNCIFRGYEVGAVDYLFKPIEPVILKSKVKIFLELYNQRKLLAEQTKLLELKVKELSELKDENSILEGLSLSDGLTGISNRRSFDQYLNMCWNNSLLSNNPLSLIMIDIDNFKAYNDNYGHLKGDECLIKVAKNISSKIKRPLDFAARYGGEEFAVILPDTDSKGAILVAEELKKGIEELSLLHEHSITADHITISLGVSTINTKQNDSLDTFINSADQALYNSKNLGRNKVSKFELEEV